MNDLMGRCALAQNNELTPPQPPVPKRTFDPFAAFKYYEEAADRRKGHAWSQTTWILALSAGILAFSANLYAEHRDIPGFLIIQCLCFAAGSILCLYLVYVLDQLGQHISSYWTNSNRLAGRYAELEPFAKHEDAVAARSPNYHAPFPKFCRRLQIPAFLFIAAQLAWACAATWFVTF
jgi:hypothetical protein